MGVGDERGDVQSSVDMFECRCDVLYVSGLLNRFQTISVQDLGLKNQKEVKGGA